MNKSKSIKNHVRIIPIVNNTYLWVLKYFLFFPNNGDLCELFIGHLRNDSCEVLSPVFLQKKIKNK